MPTDPPKTARQRALERRRLAAREAQVDDDIGMPPETPKVRRGKGSSTPRTRARSERAAKVVKLFSDGEPADPDARAAKVPRSYREEEPRRRRPATLGKRWSEVVDRIRAGEYTWDEFCQSLDPEELARGQLKDNKGGFTGRPPEFVPRQFILHCQREIHRRFDEKMKERLLAATDELIDLSRSGMMEPKDRAKVLTYLIERVVGPVPKEVHVTTEKPFEGLVAKIAGRARPTDAGEDSRYAKRDKGREDG